MSTSTSLRRRPHCHRCGSPMQGHKRKNGTFVCPEETPIFTEAFSNTRISQSHSTPLPSPPASPDGSPRTSLPPPPPPSHGFSPARGKPVFKPPPGERWHWRNPNWVSPPRKMRLYTPSDGDRGSLTPTELVTEPVASQNGTCPPSNVIREEEERDFYASWSRNIDEEEVDKEEFEYFPRHSHSLSPQSWSPSSQSPVTDVGLDAALRASTPLFKVFRTPVEDLDGVRRTARREGKHVAIMNAPPAHRALARVPTDKANATVWVVVSDRVEDLKYAIDSQQGGMPGTFFPEEPQTRGTGFFQVMFAGALGGFMVAAGLACL